MENIPSNLIASMTLASISFFLAVWLAVQIFYKKLAISLAVLAVLTGWYGFVYLLGRFGFWDRDLFFVPFIGIGFGVLFFWLRFLYSRPLLQQIADSTPAPVLIGLQIFRIMGIGFLSFYALGLIPGEFAIPTGWGDVFVGITAIPVALLLWSGKSFAKRLAIWWNYLGIADLTLALTLGNGTFPRPLQLLPTTPDNELIALFPLVMVPLFAVPLSLLLHLFTLRILKRSG